MKADFIWWPPSMRSRWLRHVKPRQKLNRGTSTPPPPHTHKVRYRLSASQEANLYLGKATGESHPVFRERVLFFICFSIADMSIMSFASKNRSFLFLTWGWVVSLWVGRTIYKINRYDLAVSTALGWESPWLHFSRPQGKRNFKTQESQTHEKFDFCIVMWKWAG